LIEEVYRFAKFTNPIMKGDECFMKNIKFDPSQALGFVGTALSVAAMVISGVAQKKSMNEAIAKEVAEALNNQNK